MVNSAGEIDAVADAQSLNQLYNITIFFGLPYDGNVDILNFRTVRPPPRKERRDLSRGIGTVGYDNPVFFPFDLGNGIKQLGIDAVGDNAESFRRYVKIPADVFFGRV